MNVSIYTSKEDLLTIKDDWTKLNQSINTHSPFLSWEWINEWWSTYETRLPNSSSLQIICIRDDKDQLFCIMPFFSTKISSINGKLNILKLAGTEFESSDYLDILIADKYSIEFIFDLFDLPEIKLLFNNFDKIVLNNLLQDSALWKIQNEFIQKRNYPTFSKRTSICPYMDLPESEEELLKNLSKNMKSGLRRTRNKINKDPDLDIHRITEANEIDTTIQALFDLHDQRFTDQEKDTKFVFEKRGRFHQNIAKTFLGLGQLAFYTAKFKDEIIGCLYCYVFNNRVMYMQAGFNPDYAKYALGNQLILKAITDGIEIKNIEFDFMRGNESYKTKWTASKRYLYQLEFGLSFKGKMDVHFNRLLFNSKRIIKKLIRKEE
ncbi:MAG: GNAT family N-acetyltransferase [Calditrichaeota bacterium]|nr:MAG: GNAT family N-acetyltransferase [Calditrichota bacterium]MBL1206368.1 GNAT family N-acetyltransferase [Calditrichota bacterium]NOG46194.1 GNAT family N-acetyltransferase [Calditrichota bacterium]